MLSMNTTGFGSRIAVFIRPFASNPFDGIATRNPGTCISQASRLCECCEPKPSVAATGARTTRGTETCPPQKYRSFGAWLVTGSMAQVKKSMNSSSQIVGRPAIANPMPKLTMAASFSGQSRTRSPPNSSYKPRVTPKTPPYLPTSSPRTITFSLRRISSQIP